MNLGNKSGVLSESRMSPRLMLPLSSKRLHQKVVTCVHQGVYLLPMKVLLLQFSNLWSLLRIMRNQLV
nr:hypothetical protein Iba_chr03aCG16530 [Ipomoea batatas]